MKSRARNSVPVGVSLILLSVAIFAGVAGVFSYRSSEALVERGQHAAGQVVAILRTSGSNTPHAVFAFTANDGRHFRVVSRTYSMFTPHIVGEQVRLIYAAGEPDEARIDEWSSLYGLPLWCALFAAGSLIVSIVAFWARNQGPVAAEPYIRREGQEINVDISSDRGHWGVPKGRRVRFALWSCALLTLPIVAALFGDRPTIIVVTGLALGFEAFLLLFSALPNQPKVVKATGVTNFYSRGYLWFQGAFWTLLISLVIWRLWAQFPR